jgi:hypothetical protein
MEATLFWGVTSIKPVSITHRMLGNLMLPINNIQARWNVISSS